MFLKRRFWNHWSLNSVGELCRTMSKGAAIGAIALLFAACDDDSGSFTGPENEAELVEISSSSKVKSSSSEKKTSSSSVGKIKSSSSQKTISSSSASEPKSSSSVSKTVLSSSVEKSKSSSSATPKSSSSSFVAWSWDVPKEARLNPDIDYGTMTDERDGKVYKTVKIGEQVWMAENLNFDPGQGGSGENKYDWSWCYQDSVRYCNVTGRLYTWAAAIDSVKLATDADNPQDCGYKKTCTLPAKVQGICPTSWHLPTYAEWNALFTAVGGQSTAGKVLKSQSGWYNNGNGTDAFGFSALPAGYRHNNGCFNYEGSYAYFWSSTEIDSGNVYSMDLYCNYENAGLSYRKEYYGFSVRCLKD